MRRALLQGGSDRISSAAPPPPALRALLVLGALALAIWPAAPPWRALIGSPLGETDNHLSMFWRATRRMLGDGRALVNAPDGLDIPLMDPVNLPVFAALWPLGPFLAWNGLILANLLLAAAGGALLSRELAGPGAAVVGAVALVSAPFLAGVVDFGISESWPLGLFALHAGCLLRHAREGGRGWALGAGASLGAIALSGWYHALFGLILEAMLVPWLLWRYRRPGTLLQGLIGLAAALPQLLAFLPARGIWSGRWHPPAPQPGPRWPDWETLPRYGTDLLNLLAPRWETVEPSKAVYLGIFLLFLVARGLWRAPRVAGPMVLLALPFLALALGHWPRVAGFPLGFRGPAWWAAELFPPLQGLSHWHRAVGAAVPFLAAAAAVGAADWAARRRGLALVCALLIADGLLSSQTPWPRPAHGAEVPEALLTLGRPAEEGAGVIQLPFDNARVEFTPTPARLYELWQVLHQHPISESYESRDALLARSRLVAAADGACGLRFTGPREHAPPEAWRRAAVPTRPSVVAAEVEALRRYGYRWIVLHEERAATPERAREALEAALGPGAQIGRSRVWDLAALKTESRGGD